MRQLKTSGSNEDFGSFLKSLDCILRANDKRKVVLKSHENREMQVEIAAIVKHKIPLMVLVPSVGNFKSNLSSTHNVQLLQSVVKRHLFTAEGKHGQTKERIQSK
jgi:hypothetical protein